MPGRRLHSTNQLASLWSPARQLYLQAVAVIPQQEARRGKKTQPALSGNTLLALTGVGLSPGIWYTSIPKSGLVIWVEKFDISASEALMDLLCEQEP